MFPNLLEAVAASYNGGEDNVARWLGARSKKIQRVYFRSVLTKPGLRAKGNDNYRVYKHSIHLT